MAKIEPFDVLLNVSLKPIFLVLLFIPRTALGSRKKPKENSRKNPGRSTAMTILLLLGLMILVAIFIFLQLLAKQDKPH